MPLKGLKSLCNVHKLNEIVFLDGSINISLSSLACVGALGRGGEGNREGGRSKGRANRWYMAEKKTTGYEVEQ